MGLYCAVSGCVGSRASKHRFPNPGKYPELFQRWILVCGRQELLERLPENVYKNCRVCRKHFMEHSFTTNNVLSKLAFPTEHLPEPLQVVFETDEDSVPEEPVPEEPVPEEPVAEEPVAEEPVPEEPVTMKDTNFSRITKPKQNDISVTLHNEATVYNEKLSEFYNSLGKELSAEVIDTLNRSNILCTNHVTKLNFSDDINEVNIRAESPLDNTHQEENAIQNLKEDRHKFCLTVNNFNAVCQTCLKQNECKDLLSDCIDNLNCAQILEMFTSIKLNPEDDFSLKICNECISELVHCYLFRQKCQKSQYILHEFKFELEKIQKKNASTQRTISESLLDHDYEQTISETTGNNFDETEKLHEIERQADIISSGTPKYVKRFFFVLKSNLDENKITDIDKNLIEINEKKAQRLIQKSAKSHQKIFFSNEKVLAADNEETSCMNITEDTNVEIDNESVKSSPPRNAVITCTKNKNTKMQEAKLFSKPFSDTTQKIIKLLAGRTHQTNRVAKLPLNVSRIRRKGKVNNKSANAKIEKIFPGNCRICDVPFLTESDYKEHAKATKHYFTEFICDVCGKLFPVKYYLVKHRKSHTSIKRFMCEKCGLRFHEKSSLSSHMKVHLKNTATSFVCETCGEVYKCRGDYLKHRRVNHIEQRFCCETCGAFLISKRSLMQHKKRTHLNPRKLEKCFICNKGIVKLFLKRHMRTHVSDKIECNLCNCAFKNQLKYIDHMKARHPGADENASSEKQIKVVECVFCQETCQNTQSISIHMSEVHDFPVCKYCDEIFLTDSELATHYITHSTIKDFSCRYCGKTFESWDNLYVHLGLHSISRLIRNSSRFKTQSFPCKFCNKCFLNKSSLDIHHRVHTGERPYVCDICGKGNICSSSFKRHRRTHFLQNGQKIS